MSRAAQLSIAILVALLFLCLGVAFFTFFEKNKVEKAKLNLEKQVVEYQGNEKKYFIEKKSLEENLTSTQQVKEKLEKEIPNLQQQIQKLNEDTVRLKQERDTFHKERDSDRKEIQQLTSDRENWKTQVETLKKERDDLIAKLRNLSSMSFQTAQDSQGQQEAPQPLADLPAIPSVDPRIDLENLAQKSDNERVWAAVLKEKAALEVHLRKYKEELSASSGEIVELKKANSDLELALNELKDEHEVVERQIKYNMDLVDTLSLEFARAKNENKFLTDRVSKVNQDNDDLRHNIKKLSEVKLALEKRVLKIMKEKDEVKNKLAETEHVIQRRVDELWGIKESINKSFEDRGVTEAAQEVELPPIIVHAKGATLDPSMSKISVKDQEDESEEEVPVAPEPSKLDMQGSVVSINDEYNFAIINLGAKDGIQLQDVFKIYRGNKFVADVEVIQTRPDISAADIKQQKGKIRVGDIVRYAL